MRLSTFLFFFGLDVLALVAIYFCVKISLLVHHLSLNLWEISVVIAVGIFSAVVFVGITTALVRMIFKGQISFLYRKENLDEE